MSRNFYFEKDELIAAGSRNFASRVLENYVVYGIMLEQAEAYQIVDQTFQEAYNASNTPGTRTTVVLRERDTARKHVQASAKQLAAIIRAQPGVDNGQLTALGLLPIRSRTRAPKPASTPTVELVYNVGRLIKLRIFESGRPARRSKADGTIGAQVYLFVGDQSPVDPRDYKYIGMTPRAFMDIHLPDTVPSGAMVWVCAKWMNKRGEHGNCSSPLRFNIQGGCIAAA